MYLCLGSEQNCIRSALTTRLDSTQLAHGLSSGVFDFFAETEAETDWHSGTYITKPRKFWVRPDRAEPSAADRICEHRTRALVRRSDGLRASAIVNRMIRVSPVVGTAGTVVVGLSWLPCSCSHILYTHTHTYTRIVVGAGFKHTQLCFAECVCALCTTGNRFASHCQLTRTQININQLNRQDTSTHTHPAKHTPHTLAGKALY